MQLLAPRRQLCLVFTWQVPLPTIVRVTSDNSQPRHWQLAGVLGLVLAVALLLGRANRGALGQAIGLKQCAEPLAAQLRIDKNRGQRGAAHCRGRQP